MKKQNNMKISKTKIKKFCQKWHIREFSLFGSVLRADYSEKSDIDVLVTFDDNAKITLFNLVDMKEELEKIFGREVDIVSRRGIESSRNKIRKENILNSREVIYVS